MTASLELDLGASGPPISKHLYGHFAEHLGRCIYDGLWVGEGSSIPNTRGVRNDIVGALRKMKVPNLRWPGGCFADQYDWRAGVGPREKRPRTINMNWGGVESNEFGTHEFLDLCEQIGAEPYLAANVGSGTPQEMFEWLDYLTFDGDSTLAAERRANGRDKPWTIPYLGIGNENWGCGGNMTAEYYADLYRRFAAYVRGIPGSNPKRVAGGPSGGDLEWVETLMTRIRPNIMDAISLHYYTTGTRGWSNKVAATGFGEGDWIEILRGALDIESMITGAERIMDRHDPNKRVAIYMDEWGTWYDRQPDDTSSALYQDNTIRDALVVAVTMHIFHDHTERVKMGNLAQLVNVLQAPILTDGAKMILTPTYHALEMLNVHQDAHRLPLEVDTPYYSFGDKIVPALSASASRDGDGKVHLSIANLDAVKAVEVDTALSGGTVSKAAGRILTADALDARNTSAAPDRVTPQAFTGAQISNGRLRLTAAPRSVIVLELTA